MANHGKGGPGSREDGVPTGMNMASDEFLARDILGHGAYVCVRRADSAVALSEASAGIASLARRLELRNEFDPHDTGPGGSIAFLRRRAATPGDIADDDVLQADAVVHVASKRTEAVDEFCGESSRLLAKGAPVRVLRGVQRPKNYTGAAMNNWAYGRQVVQQPGAVMPNALLIPLNKTAEWWTKNWMERHTYFLPRYDDRGRMISEGHALAAEAGIACLLRRTYTKLAESAAAPGDYDFITYFECADTDLAVFHQVCAALRDVKRNPEWQFVREGPAWHGHRVPSWDALFTGTDATRV